MFLAEVSSIVVGEQGGRAEQMEDHADVPSQDGQIPVLIFDLGPGYVRVILRLEVVELELQAPQPLLAQGGRDAGGVLLGFRPAGGPEILALGGEVQKGGRQQGHRLGDRIDVTGGAIVGQSSRKLVFFKGVGDLRLVGDAQVSLGGLGERPLAGQGQDFARERHRLLRRGGEVPLDGHQPIARRTVLNVHQLVAGVGEQLDRRRQRTEMAPEAVLPGVVVVQQLLELHRLGEELAQQRPCHGRTRIVAGRQIVHQGQQHVPAFFHQLVEILLIDKTFVHLQVPLLLSHCHGSASCLRYCCGVFFSRGITSTANPFGTSTWKNLGSTPALTWGSMSRIS